MHFLAQSLEGPRDISLKKRERETNSILIDHASQHASWQTQNYFYNYPVME
jgi:hypothetical protein